MPHFDITLELVFERVFGQILEPIFEPFFNAIELGPRATDLGLFPREAPRQNHESANAPIAVIT